MTSKEIEKELNILFEGRTCELNYNKDYELLLSTMLSAQTTDKRVNEVTSKLYEKYDSLEKLNKLSLEVIKEYLKPLGFYNNKSIHFKEIVRVLSSKPYDLSNRDFLESLSGVGRKTANVVLNVLYKQNTFPVDTHVKRVSYILGITSIKDNELQIEKKLMKYFKDCNINNVSTQMVLFGRYICKSKKPLCNNCPFNKKCKKTYI